MGERGTDIPAVAKAAIFDDGLAQSHRGLRPQSETHDPSIGHIGALCHIPLDHAQGASKKQACIQIFKLLRGWTHMA